MMEGRRDTQLQHSTMVGELPEAKAPRIDQRSWLSKRPQSWKAPRFAFLEVGDMSSGGRATVDEMGRDRGAKPPWQYTGPLQQAWRTDFKHGHVTERYNMESQTSWAVTDSHEAWWPWAAEGR